MSKGYGTVFFDLDGTLTDPGEGITNSVAYALEHFGIHTADKKSLECFIGPPLVDSFTEFYGFSKAEAQEAVGVYREYFSEGGLFENRLYGGVPEMLGTLKSAGLHLAVATSKPHVFAERILDRFGLSGYFDFTAGSELDGTRTAKGEVIAYALERAGIRNPSGVLMVGDRRHDAEGAAQNHMDCAGVLYGYGSRGELEQAGVKYLVAAPDELCPILI